MACGRERTYFSRIYPILAVPKISVFNFTRSWEQPDVQSMVTTTGYNHRSLGPLFAANHTISPCYFDPFRFDNNKATNDIRVTTENVFAKASVEIPNTNSPIGRTAHEGILRCG